MVQVVTTAIRSQAQQAQQQVAQQQRQLDTQRSQLERQRGQLTSAQAIRTLSREARELQTRQLSSTQQQIQQQTTQLQSATRELQRIRELPTAQELISQSRKQLQADFKLARKVAGRKDIAISSLPKRIRGIVQKFREGQSDRGIIKAEEERLGRSISAIDRQAILDLVKGITPEEIAFRQSLIATPRQVTVLPTVPLEKLFTPATKRDILRGNIAKLTPILTTLRETRPELFIPGGPLQDIRKKDFPVGKISGELLEKIFTEAAKKVQPVTAEIARRTRLGKVTTAFGERFGGRFGLPELEAVGTEKEEIEAISSILKFMFFFPPGLGRGVVKKGVKTKSSTQKTVKTSGVRFSELELNQAATNIRNRFIRKGDSAVREEIRKIVLTKDPKQIKAFKKLLEDSIGKKDTARIFKDVSQQEFLIEQGRLNIRERSRIEEAQKKLARNLIKSEGKILPSELAGRGPEFEFGPTVTTGALPQAGVVGAGAQFIGPGNEKNQARVKEALAKNVRRGIASRLTLGEKLKAAQLEVQKERSLLKTGLETKQLSKQELAQRQQARQAQKERLKLATGLLTKQQLRQRQRQRTRERLRLRFKPRRRFLKPFPFLGKKRKLPRFPSLIKKKEPGYNVFVKSRGKNLKANIRPIKRAKAFDLGASIVDRTTSRTLIVKRANKLAKKPLVRIPRNYFFITSKKFRGKILKGREQPIKNLAIERSKFAIDSLGEKRQLSAARAIANLRRKALKRIPTPKFKSTFGKKRKKK